jgi:hypothetical protein
MKTTKTILAATMLTAILATQSCKKDPPQNETNEIITTLHIVATDTATGVVQTFTFKDLDGDKPNPPSQFDSIVLSPSKGYSVNLVLLNESVNPTDSISTEILGEADDHLFVFKPSSSSLLSVAITDKDSKNLPLGLNSIWRTGNAGRGTTQIILRHQPGTKNGTETPGDSDIDLSFVTVVR